MEVRCMGCMKPYDGDYKVCPHCGFVAGTVSEDITHIVPGTVLKNRYIIGKVLGNGGFGVTYLGWDNTLMQKVAIKEYFPSDLSTREMDHLTIKAFTGNKEQNYINGRKKFIEEARTLAKMSDYPEIVSVKDFFEENNTAYIVMEYVNGTNLRDYVEKKKRLSVKETLSYLLPVMKALKEIHKAGLIHRDISPDNIMINGGRVKLLDFGAARAANFDMNQSLSIIIKHGYAPEEQYRSKGIQGPWTDIYALCATIYKCITGETPEPANDRVFNDNLKKPSALGVKIEPGLESIIMKGLSVKQADRYQSINELIMDIYKIYSQPSAAPVNNNVPVNDNAPTQKLVYTTEYPEISVTENGSMKQPEPERTKISRPENPSPAEKTQPYEPEFMGDAQPYEPEFLGDNQPDDPGFIARPQSQQYNPQFPVNNQNQQYRPEFPANNQNQQYRPEFPANNQNQQYRPDYSENNQNQQFVPEYSNVQPFDDEEDKPDIKKAVIAIVTVICVLAAIVVFFFAFSSGKNDDKSDNDNTEKTSAVEDRTDKEDKKEQREEKTSQRTEPSSQTSQQSSSSSSEATQTQTMPSSTESNTIVTNPNNPSENAGGIDSGSDTGGGNGAGSEDPGVIPGDVYDGL